MYHLLRQGLKADTCHSHSSTLAEKLREVAQPMLKNDYGRYLLSILDEGNQTLKKNLEY